MKATKLIVSIGFNIMMSMIMGLVIGSAIGVDATCIGTGLSVLSFIPIVPQGVLPISISSAYAGEVLQSLLVKATTGNQLVNRGLIRIEPNITDKFYIPRLKAGKMLQKRKEQPTDADSKGEFSIDEKVLNPQEFMAFTTFNPRSFEKIWRKWQPKGPLVFAELPSDIQSKMLMELAKVVDFELGHHFINGEEGAGATQFFNGILTRIDADGDTLKVANPALITEDNILSKMKAVRAMIPKAVRAANGLKYLMSIEDADKYDEALTNLPNKGTDPTTTNAQRFKNTSIEALSDWPEHVIVAVVATKDLNTNLWGAVSLSDDFEAVKIDRLTNAGEKYFFKMLMKADTNIAFGEECVMYDARALVD